MLKLEAKTKPQELILAYLEKNAADTLKEKINNGTPFNRDGKILNNKKTLDGFMKYATEKARKLADKGQNSACVEDNTVYGWAMHYFEEDVIEGTLFNPDGTEYLPPKKTAGAKPVAASPKKVQPQYSLFDMIDETDNSAFEEINDSGADDKSLDYADDEPNDEDISEALEIAEKEERIDAQISASPVYRQYLELQAQHPDAAVLMRLGDFYEAFGENAVTLAGELNLTLTGRDFGLPERIPVIGFPYHALNAFLPEIQKKHDVLLCEQGETAFHHKKETSTEKHWIDGNTYVDDDGLVHQTENSVPDWLSQLFNGKIIAG